MTTAQSSKKTTIYDLAELAKTSPSTVSTVLNGNWKKRRISQNLAERIQTLADENGYALNMQARALRKEKSGIIGMIVPMYDNRYFSSIAQTFEGMARERGYFPIVTSTQRDPELEASAARDMLAYQIEYLVCTGATDPDHICDLCAAAGVPTYNLDLPGTKAPSVISDNFGAALELTRRILSIVNQEQGEQNCRVVFVGGRQSDHNTKERIRGFRTAHAEIGLELEDDQILACGYAANKAANAVAGTLSGASGAPKGLFVNSTISLEGVMTSLKSELGKGTSRLTIGCFDWDPFAAMLNGNILMVRQDVPEMMKRLFVLIGSDVGAYAQLIEVPPVLVWDEQ